MPFTTLAQVWCGCALGRWMRKAVQRARKTQSGLAVDMVELFQCLHTVNYCVYVEMCLMFEKNLEADAVRTQTKVQVCGYQACSICQEEHSLS
jgi:hypothetical protein